MGHPYCGADNPYFYVVNNHYSALTPCFWHGLIRPILSLLLAAFVFLRVKHLWLRRGSDGEYGGSSQASMGYFVSHGAELGLPHTVKLNYWCNFPTLRLFVQVEGC